MKFKPGDRVVANCNLTNIYAGRIGTIVKTWPRIWSHGVIQHQYSVYLVGAWKTVSDSEEWPSHGQTTLIFNEDQLDHDVLGQLARL